MISHQHQLIFVHIPKCAGTSIENALGHYEGHVENRGGQDHRSVRMIEQPWLRPAFFTNKENLREIVRRIKYPKTTIYNQNNRLTVNQQQYRQYYKFSFVRNPWTRAFSWYRNVLQDELHRARFNLNEDTSLEDFLMRFAGQGMLQTQTYYLKNFSGDIPMDFIGRFENLTEDFAKVCDKLSLNNIELPHKVKGSGSTSDYREKYSAKAIDIIHKIYADEIALFGYNFDH